MPKKTAYIVTMLLVAFSLLLNEAKAQPPAVATLNRVIGDVTVKMTTRKKPVSAKNGKVLHIGDRIITGKNGKVTLLYRDGTELRLFERTNFLIEEAREISTAKRSFRYRFFMKVGSVWGKFKQGRQKTSIRTPTATIGVKGTALSLTDDGKTASVALAEGSIEVTNKNSSVTLLPGQRVKNFTSTDTLASKVETIPFKLNLQAEKHMLDFSKTNQEKFRLAIRLIDSATGQGVKKAGKIYLRSDYYNIDFPKMVTLDKSGFTRINVNIRPPRNTDKEFNGKILIWAIIDDANSDEVGGGNILISVKTAPTNRSININVNSGAVNN